MKLVSKALFASLGLLLASPIACSDKNANPTGGGSSGTAASCEGAPTLEKDEFCSTCTMSASAVPATCKAPRTLNACCAFVQPPTQELARGTGLNRYSTDVATVDLGCLDAPPAQGTPKTVTLKGFVRLFSSGGDSAGVKVEIFKEGKDGALGEAVGTAVTTTNDDLKNPPQMPKPDWLKKCPDGGCTFRAYEYAGVPTETPLIVKTSDGSGSQQWAALYDYNVYLSNGKVGAADTYDYEISAVATTDLNTVASAAGGFTIRPDRGLLAGEVHDCGDIRLSGATVDTDAAHEGDMFYFGENETDPLPDKTRGSLGTSKLSLFGTLNLPTGQPIKLSAVGKYNGQTVLLGSYTVQAFPGAVTALSFRGRRPWQK
jgi:hypothetical protein